MLLSAAASHLTDADVASLQAKADGFQLTFQDVAPTVDVRRLLREWDGRFTVKQGEDEGDVVVVFADAAARQVCYVGVANVGVGLLLLLYALVCVLMLSYTNSTPKST